MLPNPWLGRGAAPMAALLCLFTAPAAWALDPPAQPRPVQRSNPYRGDPAAIEPGRQTFNTHCARCHGQDASQPSAEAPDLRRLNSFCRRLKDAALKTHCLSDVDTFFLESAQEGKVRAGVQYMPPWKAVLREQQLWEIRSFVDSVPPDPPRVRTSVDRAAGP